MSPAHVEVSIDGRITRAAVDAVAQALAPAIGSGAAFTILFDRRAMTAFTPDGREALTAWWDRVEAAVTTRCAGWADVYDERRAASLQQNAHVTASAYPHAVFGDESAARAWLAMLLAERSSEQGTEHAAERVGTEVLG